MEIRLKEMTPGVSVLAMTRGDVFAIGMITYMKTTPKSDTPIDHIDVVDLLDGRLTDLKPDTRVNIVRHAKLTGDV